MSGPVRSGATISSRADAAMVVAIGELMVFHTVWKEVSHVSRTNGLDPKGTDELRKQIKIALDNLDISITDPIVR